MEEKNSGFFAKLSNITGVPIPDIVSTPILLLLVVSVGGWLIGPILYSRGNEIGRYLVWTFFGTMGVTELAHFIFPLFLPESYGYFPGMLSVVVLAPMAWYSMYQISRS